ncbi:MAG: cysteine--tRNA ligase, partial [Aestuariivirga sp.]
GEVLFDVMAMKDYGALSGRKQDELKAGARVAVDAHKKNASDFVLWKQSAADEPGWDSPWGRGRPGWHIECSVMSKAHLGEVFDIHGGGLDLIFPHHENEIAQSRCANGTHGTDVMANYWMHNGFLQVEGQKMSKSLGNFITIADLLETEKFGGRKWLGSTLKWAMLKTSYREPIDWTVTSLLEANDKLDDLARVLGEQVRPSSPTQDFLNALSDDVNMSEAKIELERLANFIRNSQNPVVDILDAQSSLLACFNLIGIDIKSHFPKGIGGGLSAEKRLHIVNLISFRLQARKAKDWAESDRIRDELDAMGVSIKDNKDGTTTWEVKR